LEIEYYNRKLREFYENPYLAIKKYNLEDLDEDKLMDLINEE
jgi:hypothetical protein